MPVKSTSVVKTPAVVTMKTVPKLFAPPASVEPKSTPPDPTTSAASGSSPRAAPLAPVNDTSVVTVPSGVIWKIVPSPFTPPSEVVP